MLEQMAKSKKEVETPKETNKPIKSKYIVLEPYSTGSESNRKDYQRNDTVHYSYEVAKQFINAKQIKKWQ